MKYKNIIKTNISKLSNFCEISHLTKKWANVGKFARNLANLVMFGRTSTKVARMLLANETIIN